MGELEAQEQERLAQDAMIQGLIDSPPEVPEAFDQNPRPPKRLCRDEQGTSEAGHDLQMPVVQVLVQNNDQAIMIPPAQPVLLEPGRLGAQLVPNPNGVPPGDDHPAEQGVPEVPLNDQGVPEPQYLPQLLVVPCKDDQGDEHSKAIDENDPNYSYAGMAELYLKKN